MTTQTIPTATDEQPVPLVTVIWARPSQIADARRWLEGSPATPASMSGFDMDTAGHVRAFEVDETDACIVYGMLSARDGEETHPTPRTGWEDAILAYRAARGVLDSFIAQRIAAGDFELHAT